MAAFDFDVLIIGSGFGGSVSALRLAEKGYRVGVLEAGRRFADADFARTSWHLKDFLWAPRLGMLGIQRIHVLKDVVVLAGAGGGAWAQRRAALPLGRALRRAALPLPPDGPQRARAGVDAPHGRHAGGL